MVDTGSQGIARDAYLSLPNESQLSGRALHFVTTYQRQILPHLLDSVALCLPLFPDDFGDIRIRKPGICGGDGMLVVLSIKDKCYKEKNAVSPATISCPQTKEQHSLFVAEYCPGALIAPIGHKENIGLTIAGAGYLGLRLTETDMFSW